ncbi:MAG: hypothetical protein P4L82_18285, partial [Ancalomicrobiaceae bacterium]|nr:hypothetical protein [Ancalomicrobiaceae bacterium]
DWLAARMQPLERPYAGADNPNSRIAAAASLPEPVLVIRAYPLFLILESHEVFFEMCDYFGMPTEPFRHRSGLCCGPPPDDLA